MKNKIKRVYEYFSSKKKRRNLSLAFGILSNSIYIVSNFLFGVFYSSFASLVLCVAYSFFVFVRYMLLVDHEGGAQRASLILLFVGPISLILTGFLSLKYDGKASSHFFSFVFGVYAVFSVLRASLSLFLMKKNCSIIEKAKEAFIINAALISCFNFIRLIFVAFINNFVYWIVLTSFAFSAVSFVSALRSYRYSAMKN